MMHWSVSSIGISTAILAVLCLLWQIEKKRGKRILFPVLRKWCDEGVLAVVARVQVLAGWLGMGTVRIVLHYVVHTILQAILYVVGKLETFLSHLQRRNRSVVKAIKTQKTQSHLDSVSAHKAAVSLSETEKQQLRDEKLRG